MQQNHVIEAQDVTKIYRPLFSGKGFTALDNVSFNVESGRTVGLIGPNGSGKTTTIKLILGLLKPTSGSVRVFGKSPTDREIKFRIGFVPEESYLYSFFSASETLDFYGRFFNLPAKERKSRTEHLLDAVGLSFAKNKKVKEYSKGMMRRLCIAQALINEPDLIIMDEPTSGLDPVSSREIRDLILKYKEMGKTILVSSHLLADIQNICDSIILLNAGKVSCMGPVKELLTNPDTISIQCKNLGPDQVEALKRFIVQSGGCVDSVGNSFYTLEEIFFKMINKS